MTKNRKYDSKNTTRAFIHGVLLRSASRRRRRKMQGVDAGMPGVDDSMQAACIPSVAPALWVVCNTYSCCSEIGLRLAAVHTATFRPVLSSVRDRR